MRQVNLEPWGFKNLRRADGIGKNHTVTVAIKSLEMCPAPRQGTVEAAVSPRLTKIGKALVIRVCPARAVGISDMDLADNPRMDLVAAIEVDPLPVDKALAGPGGCQAQRVMVVDHPGPTPRYPPCPASSRMAIPLKAKFEASLPTSKVADKLGP